eukprot:CAMPEP_0115279106 /NCGR_PEP_ID=MMETSP0270-20121206/58092_1 /TAXON_ID=71861 /ORGANISM="Scrippsiella trochoidea, Strain CCMP3099" /LENGTH=321 /DNA_ID=CAMNT_0002695783 /DNA_START=75 /DNA_END=1037 /DNA_ORIENTATION=-
MPPKAKAKGRAESVGKAKAKAKSDSSSPKAKGKAKAKASTASTPKATEPATEPATASQETSAPEAEIAAGESALAGPVAVETALPEDIAYAKVLEEAWDLVLDDLQGEPVGLGGAHVVAKDGSRTSLAAGHLEGMAVSLDFSENALERVDALPALWLRNISLGSNPLTSLDGLADLFPRLLCIDLSFVDIPSIVGGWGGLAACPRLRSLVAEGAGVSTFEDMPQFPMLQCLELLENDVEEVSEVETLGDRCPALVKLDLRENPVASEPFYIKAIAKHLPGLLEHNNQSMRKYTSKIAARSSCAADNLNKDVNAVDGLYKNE